jgi:hypothetical protein
MKPKVKNDQVFGFVIVNKDVHQESYKVVLELQNRSEAKD